MKTKGERAASAPAPSITEAGAPGLPITDEELRQAVASLVRREGVKVVSIRAVAREAQTMLGRPVSDKRVERHPKRHEVFTAAKEGKLRLVA